MKFKYFTVSLTLVAFLSTTQINFASDKDPIIFEVHTEYNASGDCAAGADTLTVYGENFDEKSKNKNGLLLLDQIELSLGIYEPLTICSATPEVITAQCPRGECTTGDYVLTFNYSKNLKKSITYDLTIGAVGPQGPVGAEGQQGQLGETGEQGAKGMQGIPGANGPKGETGAIGVQGAQGIQGNNGMIGVTGAQGPKGEAGETGAIGPQGLDGGAGITVYTNSVVSAPVGPTAKYVGVDFQQEINTAKHNNALAQNALAMCEASYPGNTAFDLKEKEAACRERRVEANRTSKVLADWQDAYNASINHSRTLQAVCNGGDLPIGGGFSDLNNGVVTSKVDTVNAGWVVTRTAGKLYTPWTATVSCLTTGS